jgi:hypothetical protein
MFLTLLAEAPILRKEIQLNSLKFFKDLPWCGSPKSMCHQSTKLHHPFRISLKQFW